MVNCLDCGTQLSAGQDRPPPCPNCGSERKVVSAEVTISAGATLATTASVRSTNKADGRVRQLDKAISEIEATVGSISDEQAATKQALEAIHELEDGRRERQEWSQTGWGHANIGLWHGLIGARNAAHHSDSPIVERDDAGLKWDVDASAIQGLPSTRQQAEYNNRLAGQLALPQLRTILALVSAALP